MRLKLFGSVLLLSAIVLAALAGVEMLRTPQHGEHSGPVRDYVLFGILLVGLARVIQAEKHHRDRMREHTLMAGREALAGRTVE